MFTIADMVIWYCETLPLFVDPYHKKLSHTSQLLRPFTFSLNRGKQNQIASFQIWKNCNFI